MDPLLWGVREQRAHRFGRSANSGSNSASRSAPAGKGPVHSRGSFNDSDCTVQLLWPQEFFVQTETDRRRREIAIRNTVGISGVLLSDCSIRCTEIKMVRIPHVARCIPARLSLCRYPAALV